MAACAAERQAKWLGLLAVLFRHWFGNGSCFAANSHANVVIQDAMKRPHQADPKRLNPEQSIAATV